MLALLGAAQFLFSGGLAGSSAIRAGVDLIVDGATEINWAKLRCDLYWLRQYLNNGLRALHDLLTLGGFSHPYPGELALDSTTITLLGIPYTFDSGKRLAKSRPLFPQHLIEVAHGDPAGRFPSKVWTGSLGAWTQMPTETNPGIEETETTAYLRAEYPPFAIDDAAANPLTADGDVRTGGRWPPGERRLPGTQVPVTFANAVDNAVDLIRHAGDSVPDWNLDGDRGLASLTWQFTGPAMADPVQIGAES